MQQLNNFFKLKKKWLELAFKASYPSQLSFLPTILSISFQDTTENLLLLAVRKQNYTL